MQRSPLRKRTRCASKRSCSQGAEPAAVKVLPKCCSTVSGSRADGSTGVDAAGKARKASGDKRKFKGWASSDALASSGACGITALAILSGRGEIEGVVANASVVCATPGPKACVAGPCCSKRCGSRSLWRPGSGWRCKTVCGCAGPKKTRTLGARRVGGTVGAALCKPLEINKKTRCKTSTPSADRKRVCSWSFNPISVQRGAYAHCETDNRYCGNQCPGP